MRIPKVYPRLRGGSINPKYPVVLREGLSPPTRGIPAAVNNPVLLDRSIPAYAGDPRTDSHPLESAPVYPRLRGGSRQFAHIVRLGFGLSPPTRGILGQSTTPARRRRSIPAYAGDPHHSGGSPHSVEVYPRLRGGSADTPGLASSKAGLSPPTRGILRQGAVDRLNERSIPAYAGDPMAIPTLMTRRKVYPRLRGGSTSPKCLCRGIQGLSPPTRGIPHHALPRRRSRRSIPAYAGDPPAPSTVSLSLTVYPRLRGGSLSIGASKDSASGLSPPTRGIHDEKTQELLDERSIPAYAGDPSPRLFR